MTTATKAPSKHATRQICLSTVNHQMEGMRILDHIPARNASSIYQDTLAINAEVRTRNEWLHKIGPSAMAAKMTAWLVNQSYSEYNRAVPESVGDMLDWANNSPGGHISFEELEDLFFQYYPDLS